MSYLMSSYPKTMNVLKELLKWSPGIISPISNIFEIVDIDKTGKAYSVDTVTYVLFILGNIVGYFFTDQYTSIKTLLAYILPSILEICIIGIKYKTDGDKNNEIIYSTVLSFILFISVFSVIYYEKNKRFSEIRSDISEISGIILAILYPVANILQLIKIR